MPNHIKKTKKKKPKMIPKICQHYYREESMEGYI